jgi:adenosylcobinamide-phosphate synthase
LSILLIAIAIDLLAGEPPERVHPVVAMGRALACLERTAPCSDSARLAYGLIAAVGVPLAWGLAAHLAERTTPVPLQAALLKSVMSGRGLLSAGRRVEDALRGGDLEQARERLHALVSRPTQDLDEPLIAAAVIESLAENLVDSWIAPLLAYVCFGLGGAYFYRAVNTADAMWGYHTPRYEWLGKGCARVDDVMNWIPARLAALLIILCGRHTRNSLRVFARDRTLTSSPNAGQPMAACAGQLGVRLEKSGHYVLNAGARLPDIRDITAARRLVARAMLVGAIGAVLTRRAIR